MLPAFTALSISVLLTGISSPIPCVLTDRPGVFLCSTSNTAAQILIWNNSARPQAQTTPCELPPAWIGIKLTTGGRVEPQAIQEVRIDGSTQSGSFSTPQAPFSEQTLHWFHVQTLPSLLNDLETLPRRRFRRLHHLESSGSFFNDARQAQMHYMRSQITFANETTIQIENQNTRCIRAHASERAREAGFGACPYLICDPIQKNGETYIPLSLHDGPEVQSTTLIGDRRLGSREAIELSEHNDFNAQRTTQKQLARCDDSRLTALIRKKETILGNAQKQLDQQTLVEMLSPVEMPSNNELMRRVLVERPIAEQQGRELPNGLYVSNTLSQDAAQNYLQSTPTYFLPALLEDATVLSESEAADLFLELSRMSDLPWSYYVEGCGYRAEVVSQRLENRGIFTFKAWAHSLLLSPDVDRGTHWRFHVAPAVAVRAQDGTVQPLVLDPALTDHPLTPQEWVALITPESLPPAVLTSFPPPSQGVFRQPTLSFSPGWIFSPFSPRRPSAWERHFNLQASQEILNQQRTLSCGN